MEKKGLFKVLIATIIIVALSVLVVGAIWTNDTVVKGKASSANMDVRFSNQSITSLDPVVGLSIVPDPDRKVITFSITKLRPGVVVNLNSLVKNEGDIGVKFDTATLSVSNPAFADYLKLYNANPWSPPGNWDDLGTWASTLNANPFWPAFVLQPGNTVPLNARIKFDPPGNEGMGQNTDVTLTVTWKTI